jgi:phosphomannomutase
MTQTSCFKAYDIRGQIPGDFNADLARRISYAYAQVIKPKRVVVGRDIRLTSNEIADAVMDGLQQAGVDVFDIGLCGTENVYFATFNQKMDGGIMITASHNPIDYNGLKLVREDARPIGAETGLKDIQELVESDDMTVPNTLTGKREQLDTWDDYIKHLMSYIDVAKLKPLKVVINPGNGGASLAIDRLEGLLPIEFIKMDYEVDGNFPNGIPNPLLPENQSKTSARVIQEKADLGIAWDGDYDRCFMFDEHGKFVNGYYLVGLITSEMLKQTPGSAIVYDPRLIWNTIDVVNEAGGTPVISKTGHSYIKKVMRDNDASYGGEISGHHYFKDFSYCDSGMIPWLLMCSVLSGTDSPISDLTADFQKRYPASDEINRQVSDPKAIIEQVEKLYQQQAESIDHIDGLSVDLKTWRFNLRMSNTEPLLRLNVETRGTEKSLSDAIDEVLEIYR